MEQKKDLWDHSIVNINLHKVAKSTVIVIIGTLLSTILFFIARLLIIRTWSQNEYGIYSLSLALPTIIIAISALGLKDGVVRNIAVARHKKDEKKISELISISFVVYLLFGIFGSVVLFLLADTIAIKIFHEQNLIIPIKIFSTLIPLTKIIEIIGAIFRGFNDVRPQIFCNEIAKSAFFLIFILFIIWFNFSFIDIFYAFSISMIISCTLIIIYAFKKLSFRKRLSFKNLNFSTFRELLLFSLPLYGSTMINVAMPWVNTVILGGIKDMASVALYNAVVPLSQVISFPAVALSLAYMPSITGLYAKNKNNEIKRNYTILTKWLFFVALPIFLALFLFSEKILLFLFDESYVAAAYAFRIVCFQGLIISLLGLNTYNLIAIGKTHVILISYLTAAILNITIAFILIPAHGVNGAAFASIFSIIATNVIMSLSLYVSTKVHPFSKNLIKTVFLSLLLIFGFYFATANLIKYNILSIFLFFIFCCLIILFSMLVTKSVDKEDLDMIDILGRKTGIKLEKIKKIFEKAM